MHLFQGEAEQVRHRQDDSPTDCNSTGDSIGDWAGPLKGQLRRNPSGVRSPMKKRHECPEGKVTEHAHGLGTVTPDMVTQRAHEIALINRRPDNKPTPEDWQEARRELTESGPSGRDPLDDIPVGKRWDPVPGSPQRKANNMPADDEQTVAESLVESGVEEAEHEQMLEGTRESVRKDRELGDSGT